jgi:UDP-3-O-[3-hydroxymyristoyl] glucosamine N-acyltransferase
MLHLINSIILTYINLKIKNSSVHKIISSIRYEYFWKGSIQNFDGINSITHAKPHEISFCSYVGSKGMNLINSSKSSLIICSIKLKPLLKKNNKTMVFVEKPRLEFIRCMRFFLESSFTKSIHPSAVIETKKFGKDIHVGPNTFISKNVKLGKNVVIHGGCNILDNTIIGDDVIIQHGTIIGADGFGPERNEKNELESFLQFGGVTIGNNVEIGSNTSIMRGTLQNTSIDKGTKIGHLVNIGHNVIIKKNCFITSSSVLGGKSIIDNNCFIGINSTIKDGVHIKKNSYIGMGSVVINDVSSFSLIVGNPGKFIRKLNSGNK